MTERVENARTLRRRANRAERLLRERNHDGTTRRDRGEGLLPRTVREQNPKELRTYPLHRAFLAKQRPVEEEAAA